MDLLYRLHSNVLTHLHDVEIVVGPETKNIPLFENFSARAHLRVTSLSRIEVNSGECLGSYELRYDGSFEPDGYSLRCQ